MAYGIYRHCGNNSKLIGVAHQNHAGVLVKVVEDQYPSSKDMHLYVSESNNKMMRYWDDAGGEWWVVLRKEHLDTVPEGTPVYSI